MSRKRKELPVLEGVKIIDIAAEGNAVARVDDMVVFVPFAAPGDVVDVKIDRKRRNYAEGHIAAMVEPSPMRVEPRCEHFTICGGCRWQHLPYEEQLRAKRQQVVDAMNRIAKVEIPEVESTLGSHNIWEYRNKMEYTYSNKRWLTREQLLSGEEFANRDGAGFHIPGAFDKVLDINRCFLQDHLGDRIRLFIKEFALANGLAFYDLRNQQGLLRTLMVRIASTGQVMVVMSFGQDDPENIKKVMDAVAAEFPEINSLMYVVNLKVNDSLADQDILLYKGVPYIEEEMEGLKFRIGPKSFYQTNSAQAYELYSVARQFAQIQPDDLVYDLYTGTGTIANFVARGCRQVVGIEYVEDAIRDAKVNSQLNGIDNTLFYAGDMKDVLTDEFIEKHGRPDIMIVDPPRAGMHQSVVDTILRAQPQRIVYVSCNPATQARDIAMLDVKYKVTRIQPVDMFPHTQHVENVVAMDLRDPS